jgi:hypothetical protein
VDTEPESPVSRALRRANEAVADFEAIIVERTRLEGWVPFGTHAPFSGLIEHIEFSDEVDEVGMPKWERVKR